MPTIDEILPNVLTVAERAWTELANPPEKSSKGTGLGDPPKWPEWALIFDTETTTDWTQALLFGTYAVACLVDGRYVTQIEGIFHADDLAHAQPNEHELLHAYADRQGLRIMPRRDFVKKVFLKVGYRMRGLNVGFNLPFDLSRIAIDVREARTRFKGGFSFILDGDERGENRRAPRVRVKHAHNKLAFFQFSKPHKPHPDMLVPDGSSDGRPVRNYAYPGRFLDLRTLSAVLTDRGHSLDSACTAFGGQNGKHTVEQHGLITEAYVAYAVQDTRATTELLNALKGEYDRHPIDLAPDKAYSSASIAKQYLQAMNLTAPLDANPDFPPVRLGQALSAYYGGRAECRIRKTPVPVVYCDFLSMYPTVNTLMRTWKLLAAAKLEAIDATQAVRELLETVTLEDVLDPGFWRKLHGFARINPDGDIVPVRANYAYADGVAGYQIGVNPLHSVADSWYALPDLVAAKLLTGKTPDVLEAWTLEATGTQAGLQLVALRGEDEINPAREDFFQRVIEMRNEVKNDEARPEEERERQQRFLKVLANSGSYGIYAEMNRQEPAEPDKLLVYAGDEPFKAKAIPELPGPYAFPPIAAVTTAAARLMLALLERMVTDEGGMYAMCDTDSMAIVAMEHGSLVPCAGGRQRMADGIEAIRALSWTQVDRIIDRIDSLNPYDRTAVPSAILKKEAENYYSGTQRRLYAYGISAKRYALYHLEPDGTPVLRKASEHGLGHLLNPTDPNDDDRDWIGQFWTGIVRGALDLEHDQPDWLDLPALTRVSLSKPGTLETFHDLNKGKPYAPQLKPFNFLLAAHVAPFGHPEGADPTKFQLIAPYESNPCKWLGLAWRNKHDGTPYALTCGEGRAPAQARVATYADTALAYVHHAEDKSRSPHSDVDPKQAVGLLTRRPVYLFERRAIGKEANKIDERAADLEHSEGDVTNDYGPRRKDWFSLHVVPLLLAKKAAEIAAATGISIRYARAIRNGRARASHAMRIQLALLVHGRVPVDAASTYVNRSRRSCTANANGAMELADA